MKDSKENTAGRSGRKARQNGRSLGKAPGNKIGKNRSHGSLEEKEAEKVEEFQ